MINKIFDEKWKKIHMIFFELLPFFKILEPDSLQLWYSGMRYRLETSCMDSSWKNSRRVFFYFLELSPLVKLRPFEKIEMKFCKCHILKSIKDRNLKLVSAERG